MTTLLDSTPVSVVEALRGDRSRRPLIDIASAGGLRSLLEDGIFDIIGAQRLDTPLVVRASSLQQPFATTDLAMSGHGRIRGVLLGQLLRLLSVGMTIEHAFDDAVAAWRSGGDTDALLTHFDALDDDDRARLATDVEAHFVTLTRALGEIPARLDAAQRRSRGPTPGRRRRRAARRRGPHDRHLDE